MAQVDPDLLSIDRGSIIAPAGCGKTELIATALRRSDAKKPILVLTHTNSGVAALRSRLKKHGVSTSRYRLGTMDGWAMRLIATYPQRAGHNPNILGKKPNYPAIRDAAYSLLKVGHVSDILKATYERLLVDEYQDCSLRQHAIAYYLSQSLPTCVVGDPVQSIFNFSRDDKLADWDKDVLAHFKQVGALNRPWRWENAGKGHIGQWLLAVRDMIINRKPIDLREAPAEVEWVQLAGDKKDFERRLAVCRTKPPIKDGRIIIVGDSMNAGSRHLLAKGTPGAVAIEAVHFNDLIDFANKFDLSSANALLAISEFAENVMTNVGAADLVDRVDTIRRGKARRAPSDVEKVALAFVAQPSYQGAIDLLYEIQQDAGVRLYRPPVFSGCIRALELAKGKDAIPFADAVIQIREQNRVLGRTLPKLSVGSTLLLKGLEAEVVVILDAESLNARNLYVALSRGSHKIVVCSTSPVLSPDW